jgi:hypothetical protein
MAYRVKTRASHPLDRNLQQEIRARTWYKKTPARKGKENKR